MVTEGRVPHDSLAERDLTEFFGRPLVGWSARSYVSSVNLASVECRERPRI